MCESPSKGPVLSNFFSQQKKCFKSILNIIHDFPGRMAENEDNSESRKTTL